MEGRYPSFTSISCGISYLFKWLHPPFPISFLLFLDDSITRDFQFPWLVLLFEHSIQDDTYRLLKFLDEYPKIDVEIRLFHSLNGPIVIPDRPLLFLLIFRPLFLEHGP